MPNFACGRTLVPDVSSPLLGVSSPRGGAEKGGNVEVECDWQVCVSSTDALVTVFSLFYSLLFIVICDLISSTFILIFTCTLLISFVFRYSHLHKCK